MNSAKNPPRVRLRLSHRELRLILPALRAIVAADHAWVTKGELTRPASDIRYYERPFDPAGYKPDGMKPFLSALTLLKNLAKEGGRARLSHFEFAACMFGARHTRTMLRHGHLEAWAAGDDAATDRLLLKLERYRRRARRRFEKCFGQEAYRQASEVWVYVIHWVYTHYLWCSCTRPKGWSNLRRWYRTVLDRCVELAAEGLHRRCCYLLAQTQLRPMVRAALRSVRRGRTEATIRFILENPQQGGDCLADFIIRTRSHLLQRFDLSTVLSDRATRLGAMQPSTNV